MSADQPTRGKRVQVYIPADLVTRWDATPRYERSAAVAQALRLFWDIKQSTTDAPNVAANVASPQETND